MTPQDKMTQFLAKLEREGNDLGAEFANIVFEIGIAKAKKEDTSSGGAPQSNVDTPYSDNFAVF